MPAVIRRYNAAQGVVNDDTQGYHETITRVYIRAVRVHCAQMPDGGLAERVNVLLAGERGRRDYPLRFYSRERLFSVPARRGFVEPDRQPLEALG